MQEHDQEEQEKPQAESVGEPFLQVDTRALALGGRGIGSQRRMLLALQRSAGNRSVLGLLRAVAPPTPTSSTAGGVAGGPPVWLIADDAQAKAGQTRLSDFLDRVREVACATAEAELAGTRWSADGCPWIEHWIDYYKLQSPADVADALARYSPEAAAADSTEAVLPLIAARISAGIKAWRQTGEITIPPEAAAALGDRAPAVGSSAADATALPSRAPPVVDDAERTSIDVDAPGKVLAREATTAGAAAAAADDRPRAVRTELGPGRPLPQTVRSRMERAFVTDFSDVRVHDDDAGAAVSGTLRAKAVTVGRHIAFAPGAYEPGTLVGDALIAHELAHVMQQDETLAGTGGPALERDANLSTAGVLTSLYGGLTPLARSARPRLRTGLALQRCNLDDEYVEEYLTGEAADKEVAANSLRLIPSRHPDPGTTGLAVSYSIESVLFASASGTHMLGPQKWWVKRPGEHDFGRRHPEDPSHLIITMDAPGEWNVAADILVRTRTENMGACGDRTVRTFVTIGSTQQIDDIDVFAAREFAALDSRPTKADAAWDRYQATLLIQKTQLMGKGVLDQNLGGPYITLDGGSNPGNARERNPGYLYTLNGTWRYAVHPDPLLPEDAPPKHPVHYRWYAIPAAVSDEVEFYRGLAGHQATTYNGRKAYRLGESAEVRFAPPAQPNTWQIVCELLDVEDRTLAVATYWQVVLSGSEYDSRMAQLERLEKQQRESARLHATLQPGTVIPLVAMHVEAATAKANELNLFIGKSVSDPTEWRLIDLTYGAAKSEFTGTSADDVLDSFEGGNRYPEGRIIVEGLVVGRRVLDSTGTSTAQEVAGGFGWASLGFAVAGGIALFTPAAPLAPYLFIAAGLTQATKGAIQLADDLGQAQVDEVGVALDVADIATGLIGVGMGGAMAKAGTRGITALRGGRYLIYAGLGGDVVQGILVTVQSGQEIDRILSEMNAGRIPHDQGFATIVRILTMLLIQGGLLAFGSHDVKTARSRLVDALGDGALVRGLKAETIGGLDALNEQVLRNLKGATAPELERVAALVRTDREAATKLAARYPDDFASAARNARSGENLAAVGEELGRLHAAKEVEPPAGAIKPKGDEPHGRAETSEETLTAGREPPDAVIADLDMTNAYGEPHAFHMTADGTIYRCSWVCEDIMRNIRERVAAMKRSLKRGTADYALADEIAADVAKLRDRAKRYADQRAARRERIERSKTPEQRQQRELKDVEKTEDNERSLMDRAKQVEDKMSGIEQRLGVQPQPDVSPLPPASAQDLRQRYADVLGSDSTLEKELKEIEGVKPAPDTSDDIARRLATLEKTLIREAEALLPEQIARARELQVPLGNRTHTVVIDGRAYEKCRARAGGHETISGGQAAAGYEQHTREVIDQSRRIGHTLASDNFDEGVAARLNRGRPANDHVPVSGAARASHAEKQAAMAARNEPVAVSLPMCYDCYEFFRKYARSIGRPQVVADPDLVRVFMPDGRVLSPSRLGTQPLRPGSGQPGSLLPTNRTHQPVQ